MAPNDFFNGLLEDPTSGTGRVTLSATPRHRARARADIDSKRGPAARASWLQRNEPVLVRPNVRGQREARARDLAVANLVEDLRDDEVKWNATAASNELLRRMRDPADYWSVCRQLEVALRSNDLQQVRLATGLLQSLTLIREPGVDPYAPSETLLDRAADQLDHWDFWVGSSWVPGDVDDEKSVAFAIEHIERMEDRLVAKLTTLPEPTRFIHAYVLGRTGRQHLSDLVVPVLIDHLRDNDARDDALMSMEALYRLGGDARRWLESARGGADEQQRACIELLLLELADPAVTAEQRAQRAPLNRVTWKCDDPVQSWRYSF
ncbi:MAG: hypothetical protein GY711_05365 [bacterium]|nr:hypothetical protein [bacterium]